MQLRASRLACHGPRVLPARGLTGRPGLAVALALLPWSLAACTRAVAISGPHGARAAEAGASVRRQAQARVPASWLEALCDRVEDCAVERNERLAERLGATPRDRALARAEAERAVVTGEVRRWCLRQMRSLDRAILGRVRACAAQPGCSAFHECAKAARRGNGRPGGTRAAQRIQLK